MTAAALERVPQDNKTLRALRGIDQPITSEEFRRIVQCGRRREAASHGAKVSPHGEAAKV
jgi:hypothetical protein